MGISHGAFRLRTIQYSFERKSRSTENSENPIEEEEAQKPPTMIELDKHLSTLHFVEFADIDRDYAYGQCTLHMFVNECYGKCANGEGKYSYLPLHSFEKQFLKQVCEQVT